MNQLWLDLGSGHRKKLGPGTVNPNPLLGNSWGESTNITLINGHTFKPPSKYIVSTSIDKCSFSLEKLLYIVDSSQNRE